MSDLKVYFSYLAVMVIVTYLLRALPFILVSKKITNRFVRSFLEYIPYSVLAAMTFPAIFTSTGAVVPSLAGTIAGMFLAYKEKGLLPVALISVAAAAVATLLPI